MKRFVLPILVLFSLVACASMNSSEEAANNHPPAKDSKTSQVIFYEGFDDVLIPKELEIVDEDCFFFENDQFRTGLLVFDGNVEHNSLADFFINHMATDGWTRRTTYKSKRTVLFFEKPNKSCMIRITDESFHNTRTEILIVEVKSGESLIIQEEPMPLSRDLPE